MHYLYNFTSDCIINRQSHAFLSNLGIIVLVTVKITLSFTCVITQTVTHSIQLFPNWIPILVITYTNNNNNNTTNNK